MQSPDINMSQPRKSERAHIPSERAKNSEMDISKMMGAPQKPSTDDDTLLLNISMNDTVDEVVMCLLRSDFLNEIILIKTIVLCL